MGRVYKYLSGIESIPQKSCMSCCVLHFPVLWKFSLSDTHTHTHLHTLSLFKYQMEDQLPKIKRVTRNCQRPK